LSDIVGMVVPSNFFWFSELWWVLGRQIADRRAHVNGALRRFPAMTVRVYELIIKSPQARSSEVRLSVKASEHPDDTPVANAAEPRRRLILLFCAAILLSAPTAGESLYPGIIGQVNVGGYRRVGKCTGTLVAPDLVLTAAHCVVDPWKAAPVPLHDIHFLAAAGAAANGPHSTAKCLHFPAGYQIPPKAVTNPRAHGVGLRELATDMVAIVLNDKLDVAPMPVATGVDPRPGLTLIHAAYPADRRYVLSAHFGCHLLRADADPAVWHNDCDTHPASSGGPVLVNGDAAPQLAAVMVAAGNGSPNVAVPVSAHSELTRDRTCPN
jgi:V8-like Glu-specific endopeptidase